MTKDRSADNLIVVCADDYGFAPGVGVGIRRLIEAGRISATSCMTISPFWPQEAALLRPLADRADLGLHFTLTDMPPAAPMPDLAPAGCLPSLGWLVLRAFRGRIDRVEIAAELDRQIDRFVAAIGCLPDFLDGHKHVHQLPVIREVVLEVFARRLKPSGAWLRYTTMPLTDVTRHRVAVSRTLLIDMLGGDFRKRGEALAIRGNGWFRGIRLFTSWPGYGALLPRMLKGVEGPGLLMCHPGLVDDELRATDPVTTSREDELQTLLSDEFPELLAERGFRIGRLAKPN